MPSKSIRSPRDEVNRFSGNTIKILVGEDQEACNVHQNLICASSSFFEAIVAQWQEPFNRTIEMPNDEPEIFTIYIHWLYCGTLPVFCDTTHEPSDEDRNTDDGTEGTAMNDADLQAGSDIDGSSEDDEDGDSEYLELVKSYALGERILDPSFQNAVIDAILEKSTTETRDGSRYYPPGDAIQYAFNNTSECAPIRRLLVDIYAREGESSWLEGSYWRDDQSNIPQPFLLGLASSLFKNGQERLPPLRSSDYHTQIPTEVKDECDQ